MSDDEGSLGSINVDTLDGLGGVAGTPPIGQNQTPSPALHAQPAQHAPHPHSPQIPNGLMGGALQIDPTWAAAIQQLDGAKDAVREAFVEMAGLQADLEAANARADAASAESEQNADLIKNLVEAFPTEYNEDYDEMGIKARQLFRMEGQLTAFRQQFDIPADVDVFDALGRGLLSVQSGIGVVNEARELLKADAAKDAGSKRKRSEEADELNEQIAALATTYNKFRASLSFEP